MNFFSKTPVSVELLVTGLCNLSCKHCYIPKQRHLPKEKELDSEEWKHVLNDLKHADIFTVTLSGGEVFCRQDALEIIRCASNLNFRRLDLLSNATLVDEHIARELSRCRLNISVSIDGTQMIHDDIRGQGAFEKAWIGLEALLTVGLRPSILFTVMRTNWRSIPELAQMLDNAKVGKLVINMVSVCELGPEEFELLNLSRCEVRELEKMIKQLQGQMQHLNIHFTSKYTNIEEQSPPPKASNMKGCSAAHSSCSIDPTGHVIPCAGFYDHRTEKVTERNFVEMWQKSDKLNEIRMLSNLVMSDSPFCTDCEHVVKCDGGCRANAWNYFGHLLAPNPLCPMMADIKQFGFKTSIPVPEESLAYACK